MSYMCGFYMVENWDYSLLPIILLFTVTCKNLSMVSAANKAYNKLTVHLTNLLEVHWTLNNYEMVHNLVNNI